MGDNADGETGSLTQDHLQALNSPSPPVRTDILRQIQLRIENPDVQASEIKSFLPYLLSTYPRYFDRKSRRAVQACLQAYLKNETYSSQVSETLTKFLLAESQKGVIAASSAFVLLEWCCLAQQELVNNPNDFGSIFPKLCSAAASLLDKCEYEEVRGGVQNSALVISRRGLRHVFKGPRGQTALQLVLKELSAGAAPSAKDAPYLGVVCGVAWRIPERRKELQEKNRDILEYYTKAIVNSKTAVPPHQAGGLKDFFSGFVDVKALSDTVIPAMEKSILRSPEAILQGTISSFALSLPGEMDIAGLVHNHLLKQLLSALGSTNVTVRDGASRSLRALLERGGSPHQLQKLAIGIANGLKATKPANFEPRGILADCLTAIKAEEIDTDTAGQLVEILIASAAKETNETALRKTLAASAIYLHVLLQSQTVGKVVTESYTKGAADKKPNFRKLWLFSLAEVINRIHTLSTDSKARDFIVSAAKHLKTAFDEVSAAPLPSAQSGLAGAGYALLGLGNEVLQVPEFKFIQTKNNIKQAFAIDSKTSFALNPKVYTKLTSLEDGRWMLRALANLGLELDQVEQSSRLAWARAFIHLLVSPELDSKLRMETSATLTQAYVSHPGSVGMSVISGIWDIVQERQQDLPGQKEEVPVELRRLQSAVQCITVSKDKWSQSQNGFPSRILEQQLIASIVLLRPELVERADWIQNCLSMGIDPGNLVEREHKACMTEILSKFDNGKLGALSIIENAACDATATLAFVAPDTMIPLLIKQFEQDLDSYKLAELGPTDAAIARAPEGIVFVDVLSQKANGYIENKNVKDYDLLKWEAEVRAQLAQKKGAQPKKLSADQQAKVDAQLKYETDVRQTVRTLSSNIRRGAGFVKALSTGPPTDTRQWMTPAVNSLIDTLAAGAALITDQEVVDAYLTCSNQVTERLGTMRPFVGAATMRAHPNVSLPESLTSEPLEELGTRVLYRLRFAAEQRPFDTPSFAYTLPLISLVLEHSRIGQANNEDADAQVLLALEYLSYQMSTCTDPYLPRARLLQLMISSMQKYPQHYRILKDCIMDICRALTENLKPEERDILLSSTTVAELSTRSAVLQAIQAELEFPDIEYSVNIWIACQDEDEENADTALAIWEENEFLVEDAVVDALPKFLFNRAKSTRAAAAKSLAQALVAKPERLTGILEQLENSYKTEAQPLAPKKDKYGIVQRGELSDPWERRSGLALAFKELGTLLQPGQLVPFMEFMVSNGPLCDRHGTVRSEMMTAGINLVSVRGQEALEPLMTVFERTLSEPDKGTQEADWVNEAVIVLYGSVARHLPEGDPRVDKVLTRLIDTLSTPSESVQFAVAECLPPLIRSKSVDAGKYLTSLTDQLLQGKKYAARRGAAFGLAGFVKGKGVALLRQHRLMSTLRSATENKKVAEQRQGAMFAYELLSLILGRTFEPYVVEVLPQLLACFGDANTSVREATQDAAKTCFASLSSFGVHQVLPRLLDGLDDTQWRSKKGACDLLGAMAYLDPGQLAASLPDIIPPLTAALTDTHKEVRAAANSSLQRFGEVITNPEVKSLVDILLKALSDPTKYTEEALDSLIRVSFIHYLDAPSLALVVRILQRGLTDKSSTKRKAAQIIGSLAHLTEKRDIITHLPILVSGLRGASIDPVPATRATASKALGSLVEKLGEDSLPDLIPSLMSSLRTDTGAGDRLGSAQALSEVLAGLGTARLEETLPTILQNVQSTRAIVREGFMTLFIFLPACFGNSFANYLNQIIPSILGGLADDIEAIRDIALRAGRLLVKNFASKSIDLLLPELQRGLADDNYRIRLSSVELVGDLLFNLTGISGTMEAADEEQETAAQAGQSLLEVLGEDRRNRVLSSLYICRCDTSGLVRAAAINVWKALVATPRTLREIVPTLSQMIITRLGSSNMEQKVIAGNALGEVIRKAGEGVLTTLLPALEQGLHTSTDSDNRQGICIALREIVNSASPDALIDHEKKLIGIVRIALVDSNTDVREAAAESFDALQQTFGKRAVDQVLPHLLNLLRSDDEADNALSALLTLLTDATRANVILPNLIPTLLTNPVSAFNARALASLAKVAGASMTRRLPAILNTLTDNIVSSKDDERKSELEAAFDTVLSSVDEYDGLNSAMSVMLSLMKHDEHKKRAIAATRLASFFAAPVVDYSRYNQDLIRVLLISFGDRDKDVVSSSWNALNQLQTHLRKEEMESLVPSTRQVLQQAGPAGANLPGFALPKGILPVLQIFLQGLMNGTPEQRMQAALGISDLIDRAGPESLKPFVTQITGPLIRVVGERSQDVKAAILYALNQLLEKIPTFLRPFLPQLQRTFTKSIADPSSDVLRTRATKGLSTLITLTPRIDPLIAELVTGAKTTDTGVRSAMLKALQEVVSKVGANMSDGSRESILGLMDSQQDGQDDNMTVTNARLLGAMIKVLPAEKAALLIKTRVLIQPPTGASIISLNAVLAESPSSLLDAYNTETLSTLSAGLASSLSIQQQSVLAAGKYLLSEGTMQDQNATQQLFESLSSVLRPGGDIDARRLSLVVIRTVGRHHAEEIQKYLAVLVPPVFASVRDPVIPIKLAAEAAFLELFSVVDEESSIFDKFMADPKGGKSLAAMQQRSMNDYFKRIAVRLGAQARERRDAEGGAGGLGLSSDEQEDEKELWSVGKVDLGEAFSNE